MASALSGDDVYGEDESITELEHHVALQTGKEKALFVMTGTMGNLLSIMAQCDRGDEIICGHLSHLSKYEQGNLAQFGGVHSRQVINQRDGTIELDSAFSSGYFSNDDFHSCQTKLICIENTHNMLGGLVLDSENYLRQLYTRAHENSCFIHTDGARLVNAAVAENKSLKDLCAYTDSVSICFTKGLGAPVGAAIAGSSRVIDRARRLRKGLGGQWRQGGHLAAVCKYALDNYHEPIERDHHYAKYWAEELIDIGYDVVKPQTNIVLISMKTAQQAEKLVEQLADRNVNVQQAAEASFVRAVFHRSVDYTKLDDSLLIMKQLKSVD